MVTLACTMAYYSPRFAGPTVPGNGFSRQEGVCGVLVGTMHLGRVFLHVVATATQPSPKAPRDAMLQPHATLVTYQAVRS